MATVCINCIIKNAPRSGSRTSVRRIGQRRGFACYGARLATEVRIVEVGPRDGLQNEKQTIPVETKIKLIEKLAATGLETIEAGSFVSPKWVPQMANSSDVLEHILKTRPASKRPITWQWLLPNAKGFDNYFKVMDSLGESQTGDQSIQHERGPAANTSSADANAGPTTSSGVEAMKGLNHQHEISLFMAATEAFSKKNTNCSVAESLERFKPLVERAKNANTKVRAYISVALGCPYEGPDVDPKRVAEIARELLEMGSDEVSVADTTGMGTAPKTAELLRTLSAAGIQSQDLAFHFHDTYGQALVNTVVALEHGIRTFDSAVAGLGGCPFSPGATGNVATEDMIHCLHSLGASTGVDIEGVAEVGSWIVNEIGKGNESRAGKATLAKKR